MGGNWKRQDGCFKNGAYMQTTACGIGQLFVPRIAGKAEDSKPVT
jgi:hypothetical protein